MSEENYEEVSFRGLCMPCRGAQRGGKKTQRSSQRAEGVLRILSQNGGMWLKNQVKRLCCKDIDFLEIFKIIGNKSTQKLFVVRKNGYLCRLKTNIIQLTYLK